ncbi:MAG TPA: hypothetical protein VGO78_12480, partial [Acidimicrobiales bacterium]|nr:hypothetical protein [Acidimicrobiales bacterium]
AFRSRHAGIPIGILTYANIVAARGIERFSAELAARWDSPAQPPAKRHLWSRPIEPEGDIETALPPASLDRDEEVRRLAARVEAFVCETLLVSERTPELHRFALPRFTCLYRLLSTARNPARTDPDSKLVSDYDVRTSLVDAGFPPEHWETFLTWERELLARLPAQPAERAATVLLEKLVGTGLRNGLDETTAREVVCQMWSDIESWRTPRTSRRKSRRSPWAPAGVS